MIHANDVKMYLPMYTCILSELWRLEGKIALGFGVCLFTICYIVHHHVNVRT